MDDVVLLAAGDIADCLSDGDEQTAAILDGEPGAVATLGDNVYESGTALEFAACYHPTWGRTKARTRPSVGNHEYLSPGAAGYYGYFGAAAGDPARGYYSYDLGAWHVVVLNSECWAVGGCGAGSPQERWLRADLERSAAACTLAYWHSPRWSSGRHGSNALYDAFWRALHGHGAELVLNGHDHMYERFARQNPSGVPDDAYGIRQFVVGTGGRRLYTDYRAAANSEVFQGHTFGVLKLSLRPAGYAWSFLPVAGKTFGDLGSGACHGKPDAVPPSVTLVAPRERAVVRGYTVVAAEAADDVALDRVELSAGDALLATRATPPFSTAWDTTTVPEGPATLVARAVDRSGNATAARRRVIVDNAPPETRIVRAPARTTTARAATFAFASSERGSRFECRLDARPWRRCASPTTYRRLARGAHRFSVRARDAAGSRDATPATRVWRIR